MTCGRRASRAPRFARRDRDSEHGRDIVLAASAPELAPWMGHIARPSAVLTPERIHPGAARPWRRPESQRSEALARDDRGMRGADACADACADGEHARDRRMRAEGWGRPKAAPPPSAVRKLRDQPTCDDAPAELTLSISAGLSYGFTDFWR